MNRQETTRERLTKCSEIIKHQSPDNQLGKLMIACAHLCGNASECRERGVEISDELNEHAAEVVVLLMQIYTRAHLYWVGEFENAIDKIIDKQIEEIEVENEKNT